MDEDSGIRDLTVNALTYCVNREVLSIETAGSAWQYLKDGNGADMVICDADMPDMNGFDLMAKVKQAYPGKIFILMSGVQDDEKKAELAGADAFLGKPFSINDLFNIVQCFIVD